MVLNKSKKAKIEREGDKENEPINEELFQSIEKLQEIQDELEKVNEAASEKVLEVEQKYNEKRRPVYLKRNEIIQSIPDFWLTAFLGHPVLCNLLTDEDQKIFKYLVSLDVEDSKDLKSGYTITFNFSPNPYFEDTKLVKSYTFLGDERTEIIGTTIKWKEGMDILSNANHEKKGTKRPVNEESFFTWFGETEMERIFDEMEGIFDEVVDLLKEDLWLNPFRYFNNEADEEDFDDEEDDDDENEEEDDGVEEEE